MQENSSHQTRVIFNFGRFGIFRNLISSRWSLVAILLLATFFRLFHLTQSPPALNWDEVSIGYNAYSILKTGRDEWGHRFPLFFKAYGEYKLPGMIYSSIPAITVFGLNDFSVRLTPALIGVLAVYALYLLGRELFDEKIGLFASLLMAISPWHVHLSRASFEAGLALLFFELSALSFVRYLKHKTQASLLLATCYMLLAIYTYNSARILVPLFAFTYLFLFRHHFRRLSKRSAFILFSILLLVLPAYLQLTKPEARIRLNTLSILNNQGFLQQIGESRGYTRLPSPLPQLIHNKYTHLAYTVFFNYLKTFSTEFLFFQGSHYTQRSVQGMGLLYLFELPLLIFGFYQLHRQHSQLAKFIIYPWLLLAPLPSAITIDAPAALRSLNLLPSLLLIEALGSVYLFKLIRSKSIILKLTLTTFILWNIAYFGYRLFYVYPVKYASDWQWGYRQAVTHSMQFYDSVNKIYFTTKYGEPYMYFLFYTQYDPHRFQTGRVERVVDKYGWVHVVSFDKFYFTDFAGLQSPQEVLARNKGKFLFVGAFAQLPPDKQLQPTFTITAPNWVTMFDAKIGSSL